MTASRDIQNARSTSQHRATLGATASSVPARSSLSRPHTHSISLGSVSGGHRVSRRKSSSSLAGINVAALTAAVREGAVDANGKLKFNGKDSSAIVDDPSALSSMAFEKSSLTKVRGHRASDANRTSTAATLTGKSERSKSNADELRCDQCGKSYKHGSCLSKHLWEHTPHWAVTSKLLISKHQQVQLLEAAKVLVGMNAERGSEPNDSALHNDSSDMSSDSPAPSGTSDIREEDEEDEDDDASSRTSTPSLDGSATRRAIHAYRTPKREDSYSSAFSRSYQSIPEEHLTATSAPVERDGLSHYRQWHNERPSTSHSNAAGRFVSAEEQRDVSSAADGLVSFSLTTPTYGPTHLGSSDIPPIPEIPSKYKPSLARYSTDIEMNESEVRTRPSTRGREDEDDLVFGRMEQ